MAMDKLGNYVSPGVLLGETHFHCRGKEGILVDAVARIAAEGFYRVIEIPDIPEKHDRKRLGELVRGNGLGLTYWLSFVLNAEGLDLSSVDEEHRVHSVRRLQEHFGAAQECGATRFAILSGKDCGPGLRPKAVGQLERSLGELAGAAEPYGLRIVLEPLDRGAHKNGLIGPTAEAAALVKRVRAVFPNVGLSWDTAHAALCGETPEESLAAFSDCIAQVHLANAVLDRNHPGYGDHHMPPGPPGFLTTARTAQILAAGLAAGFFGESRPGVSVEIRTPSGGDPWETECLGRNLLEQAWQTCRQKESRDEI